MAKDKPNLNIFAKTEPGRAGGQDNSDLDEGNVRPVGVGLRQGEIQALDDIAAQYEISRGAVMALAIRLFILSHRAGNVDLRPYLEEPPPAKKRIRRPR